MAHILSWRILPNSVPALFIIKTFCSRCIYYGCLSQWNHLWHIIMKIAFALFAVFLVHITATMKWWIKKTNNKQTTTISARPVQHFQCHKLHCIEPQIRNNKKSKHKAHFFTLHFLPYFKRFIYLLLLGIMGVTLYIEFY